MKKTILGIITVVMLVAVMLTTRVNAASLSADKTKIQKGDIVTVTIKTGEKVESMQFDLKFDTTKYELVKDSIKTDLKMMDYNVNNGVLTVSAFDTSVTTDTITVQFKALENGEKVPFEISNTEFSNDEEMTNTTVEVTVADKQEPVTPVDPDKKDDNTTKDDIKPSTDTTKPGKDNTDSSKDNTYVDEDGNKITKLPQAGSLVPSIALGVAVLGIATVAGYKMIKNK